jgi:hypothetical protein
MRSVYLQKNKDIFKVHDLPAEEYAQSIGLPGAPKIKFVKASAAKEAQRAETKAKQAVATKAEEEESSSEEEDSDIEESLPTPKVMIVSIYLLVNVYVADQFSFRLPSQHPKSKRCSYERIKIFFLNITISLWTMRTKMIY